MAKPLEQQPAIFGGVFGLSPEAAAKASSLGRTKIFRAIKDGRLRARKDGRRTIVLPDDLAKFLHSLPLKETA